MLKRIVDSILDFFRSLFWKQEMELTLVGLQNSGKTTLVNVISVCALPLSPSLSFSPLSCALGLLQARLCS